MLLRKPKKRRSGPNEWKQYGYEHDSISPDAYCMYERAAKLAGMAGSDNPFFSSVDTWSFGASLERAKTYYRLRYQTEAPNGQSVDELSNSALRKRFYAYAQETVGRGYVHETELSFDAFFPRLPKNTDEMRSTILYTEAVYPKTIDAQGLSVLHAWSGARVLLRARMGLAQYRKWMPQDLTHLALIANSFQAAWERLPRRLRRSKTASNTITTRWPKRRMSIRKQGKNSIL